MTTPADPVPLLDHDILDGDHLEFAYLVGQLAGTRDKGAFIEGFSRLVSHTERHFERESELMRHSDFPAKREHEAEHDRVLGQLKQFKERVDGGLVSMGRAFVSDMLPAWLELHVSTMDSALVAHLRRRSARGPGLESS